MSFILSALKKVENKRNLGSVPELSSIQIQSFDNPNSLRHRISIALSIVSIVAVAIFAILWFYNPLPEQTSTEQKLHSVMVTPPVVDGVIPQTHQPSVVQTAPPTSPAAAPSNIVPATAPPSNPAPIYYPPQQPTVNNNVAAQSPATAPAYTAPPSPHLYQNPTDAPEWEPLPVGIVNYEELPNGLRQRIPNIELSAHIHSDLRPQARKVIINGVSLREKQRLSNDLSVHQINADGVVMDYQGTLFLLSKTRIFN